MSGAAGRPGPEVTPGRRALVFWTATALIGVDTLLFTMVVPALPEFAERQGFSDAVAALLFAAFPVAQLLTALVAAGLVERLGRKPVLVGAALMLSVATLAFALAGSPAGLTLARAAQGLAAGLVWTAGIAAISDVHPANELGFRIGLAETAGGALGLAGPIAGGAAIDAVGTDAAFLGAAALPLLALAPAALLPETARRRGRPAPLRPALRLLAAQPKARVACAALGLVAGVLALVEPLLPLDLDRRLGLSPLGVGLVFSAGLAAYLVAVPLAGRWSDRRGRRGPVLAGGALMTAGLPAMATGPAPLVAAAFAVVGLGMAGMAAPSGPLMVEAVDEAGMAGRYGLSGAVLTVVFSGGYSLGPLVGAAASAAAPFLAALLAAAAAAAAVTVWGARRLPRGAPRAGPP